jgi:hypothetical protein
MPFSATPLPTTKFPSCPVHGHTYVQRRSDEPHIEQIKARTDLVGRCRSAYGASKACKAVRGMIRQALAETGVRCDSAVLAGLGELDAVVNDNMRGPWQLAMFLDCVDCIEEEMVGVQVLDAIALLELDEGEAEKTQKKEDKDTADEPEKHIRLYAQDPHFGKLEKEILTSFGFQIVEAPEVRHHITSNTFLFAPFVEWPMLIPQIIGARDPFLYIGSDKNVMIEILSILDPV